MVLMIDVDMTKCIIYCEMMILTQFRGVGENPISITLSDGIRSLVKYHSSPIPMHHTLKHPPSHPQSSQPFPPSQPSPPSSSSSPSSSPSRSPPPS